MHRIQPSKALPSNSAPSVLWKFFEQDVVQPLHQQFAGVLVEGCGKLPDAWNTSELILLPKPNKSLSTPAHLRPICLLLLQSKDTRCHSTLHALPPRSPLHEVSDRVSKGKQRILRSNAVLYRQDPRSNYPDKSVTGTTFRASALYRRVSPSEIL